MVIDLVIINPEQGRFLSSCICVSTGCTVCCYRWCIETCAAGFFRLVACWSVSSWNIRLGRFTRLH